MLKIVKYFLLILSIVCAACSKQLDHAFAKNGALQRVILVFAAGVFLIVFIPLLFSILF